MLANSSAASLSPRPHRSRTRTAAVTVALAVTGVLAGTVPAAQATAHGTTSRCGGRGVDEDAVIRYRSDVVIKAPLSRIWRLQTDIERWPS